MRDVEIQTLRNRIAQLAAEGREQNARRRPGCWPNCRCVAPVGFNPRGPLAERRVPRLRYPVIEVN